MEQKIKAYIIRVDEEGRQYKGYFTEILNTLEAKQEIVGGLIQVIRLTPDIDIIINDEGKLRGMPLNRIWLSEDGETLDFLVGNIIAVRHCDDVFTDILSEDCEIIERLLPPIRLNMSVMGKEGKYRTNSIFYFNHDELLDYEECADED